MRPVRVLPGRHEHEHEGEGEDEGCAAVLLRVGTGAVREEHLLAEHKARLRPGGSRARGAAEGAVPWLARAEGYRVAGNEQFRAGLERDAAMQYKRALHCLRRHPKAQAQRTRSVLYANLSACALAEDDFAKARAYASKAIRADTGNAKAYFRRFSARRYAAFDLGGAEEDIRRAVALQPGDATLQSALHAFLLAKQRHSEQAAQVAKNMFQAS